MQLFRTKKEYSEEKRVLGCGAQVVVVEMSAHRMPFQSGATRQIHLLHPSQHPLLQCNQGRNAIYRASKKLTGHFDIIRTDVSFVTQLSVRGQQGTGRSANAWHILSHRTPCMRHLARGVAALRQNLALTELTRSDMYHNAHTYEVMRPCDSPMQRRSYQRYTLTIRTARSCQ